MTSPELPATNNPTSTSKASGRRWQVIARRADFLRVAASGLRRATPGFVLQAAKSDLSDAHAVRIGFTASRKVGNAVLRNRAKRRLRALADRVMADTANPNMDYVLIGRIETVSREFAIMEKDLRDALKRIGQPRR